MLQKVSDLLASARPNPAHTGLGRLQELGLLHTIITQNVDYLHQEGSATRVIEYHGNAKTLVCLWCKQRYDSDKLGGQIPPKCSCGKILKPDVVFFGEPIPIRAPQESYELASSCRALLIVGTSGEVAPANTIPETAKRAGATIIEVNVERTVLTEYLTDIFLKGKASEVVGKLVSEVETLVAWRQSALMKPQTLSTKFPGFRFQCSPLPLRFRRDLRQVSGFTPCVFSPDT